MPPPLIVGKGLPTYLCCGLVSKRKSGCGTCLSFGAPRLDLRQCLGEGILGDFSVIGSLRAQPVAIGKAEEPAQAQIGVRGNSAFARHDVSELPPAVSRWLRSSSARSRQKKRLLPLDGGGPRWG